MIKFEIYTDHFEFRFGRTQASVPSMTGREVFDQYLQLTANDPTLRESFNDLETAKAAFSRTYANWGTTRAEAAYTCWILTGDVAYLEENRYDDDGEFDQGGDIHTYSAEGYANLEEEEDLEWVRVVGDDGTFYDYVPSQMEEHLEWLRDGGYYAVPVKESEVPPCIYRDFGSSQISYYERKWHGGTEFYLPTTEEDQDALSALEEDLQ